MNEKPQDPSSSIERTMVRNALEQAHRETALAAKLLGISRMELQQRTLQYGLTTDALPDSASERPTLTT